MNIYNHNCTLCILHKGAKTVCMEGSGDIIFRAMIVGEAPGRNEDQRGCPFVGEAGKLLDTALGLTWEAYDHPNPRSLFFVTNAVKCRPPQNAKPTLKQRKACFEYLHREIKKVDPIAILALGNTAIEVLLNTSGIMRARGKWRQLDRERTTWVMPSWHPAYILRQGGYGSEEYEQFVSDVDSFVGKVTAWHGEHPDDR